jgi:hypothetical protein
MTCEATVSEGRPRILAPTALEAWMARRELRTVPVTRTGVALSRWPEREDGSVVLLCGLAGALTLDLEPGSIVVPEVIGLPDGRQIRCHPGWSWTLVTAARALGFETDTRPLLTAPALVTGGARARWAEQGFVAADMEAGLLAARGWEVATVRVILDTPARSLAGDWERPSRAILRPRLWREAVWLAHSAPRYSSRAARIVHHALELAPP